LGGSVLLGWVKFGSGCESGSLEEFVDGAVVGVAGGAELAWLVGQGFGEFAESVSEEAVVGADEEQRPPVS
jgi:hypothetical protein